MAIFYTDSGSFNDLKVTGSSIISASRGIALQLKSSGSTIFSVSGSSGEIFNISDAGSSTALFTVASSSTNILNVDTAKNVSVSGSLVVTGSAYLRGLGTTAQTNVVTIDTSTGQLYTTASSALSVTIPTPTFIATGSVTASVNIGTGDIFTVTSASLTEFAVRGTGVRIGNAITDIHTVTGSLNISGSLNATSSWAINALTSSKVIGGTTNYIARWTDSRTLSIGSIQDDNATVTIGVRTIVGSSNTATGANSFAQGNSVSATGQNAHAQGVFAIASGNNSHAEGYQTTASNDQSHAEGNQTLASGVGSHAEGLLTRAIGQYSHTEGRETIASGSYQLAIGQYNRRGNTTSLFIIGNGTGDADVDRSDVIRVETSGIQISGSLTVVSGSTEFQVLGTGVKMGNATGDVHTVTGSLLVDSTLYVTQSRIGIGTGTTAPATTLQVNGGMLVGQSGSNMNQRIDFIRSSDGASMTGMSAGNGIIQIGGGNLNFVDVYAANEYVARFNEIIAGPGVPALNLKGPLSVSGSGYAGTVDYMLNVRGSGVSGSFNANNTLITSGSHTILPQVSSSLNFTNDTNAAAGGVPLGGLYRNGNAIQIRLV